MERVLTMILAGGQGDRLSVLSEQRAKPAVVFGGHYRIIDFALSNCANSGARDVAILTQYRPRSLMNHIGAGRQWGFDALENQIQILQPYLGRQDSDWYTGTADAVYSNLYVIEESRADEILILAGDHIYLTDYREMLEFHRRQQADITVAVYQVPMEDAHRFGCLELDEAGQITDWQEKPAQPKSNWISMGIYIFNHATLVEALQRDHDDPESANDFGRNIIPDTYRSARVFGYRYQGYWRDVGTVDSYWQAHMDLLDSDPELTLGDPLLRLRTYSATRPPAHTGPRATVRSSMLSPGSRVRGEVTRSVISPGVVIEEGAVVRDSIVQHGAIIRAGAVVDHSILDKEVIVGEGAVVGHGDSSIANRERPDIVSSGITIVGKRVRIPENLRIGRNVVLGPGVRDELLGLTELESGATVQPEEMPLHMFV